MSVLIPANDPSPFESSGAGSYYLKTDDTRFRGKGTQTLGTALLNSLKTRTTQLPLAFPRWMDVTGELTLFPRAARYVSGPPDLGYYYDALDYTVAAMLLEGATITVEPGTAVAVRNDSYIWYDEFNQPWAAFTTWGFIMYDGSSFVSRGSPATPNIFTTVELVQDGTSVQPGGAPFGKWLGVPCRAELFNITGNEPEPVLDFRFSNFSLPSAWCYHFITGNNFNRPHYVSWINKSALRLSLRDCNLTSGQIDLGYPGYDASGELYPGVANLDWQNNLFDRVSMNLDPAFAPDSPSVDFAFRAQNNLFRGGLLTLVPTPAPTIHYYLPGILNLPQLAAALLAQADPVSVYLYGRLSTDTQTLLANYGGGDDWVLQSALAQELSAIILGVSIYDATRFAGVTLRQETLDLLALNPTGPYLARLNRLLLEDAFPGDLLSMSLSLWTFKDNLFDKVAFEQYQIRCS